MTSPGEEARGRGLRGGEWGPGRQWLEPGASLRGDSQPGKGKNALTFFREVNKVRECWLGSIRAASCEGPGWGLMALRGVREEARCQGHSCLWEECGGEQHRCTLRPGGPAIPEDVSVPLVREGAALGCGPCRPHLRD